ncbi:MAG: uroporphyrinogen decarboxylase [Thermoanaerobacteraceae bacterium]|uniref:uroporphyrinogen decarboxylase family protein n=1 Tax=Thermanaeromonas sp. C210 TaxID=2731925 RepID=UPI00155D50D2|nr:uroporphyrinogen decarboxylase family protein [Thermanaeromonas sp. C210]MBE3581666.1 uroporphyrinogen decarboxylase [Thermoanaerobacteraceae bacterium]GFN22372.1 uroporphyrinogen decarboxylase [Thermanaeromonas sp. C210]
MGGKEQLFQERFKRYSVAMECGKPDKVPVVFPLGEWVIKYSDITLQEAYYDVDKATAVIDGVLKDLDFDVMFGSINLWWPPMFDAVGCRQYKFPGIYFEADAGFQYVEEEFMKAEDYDDFIANPTQWLVENYLPRVNEEFSEPGSYRATVALIKGAAGFAMHNGKTAQVAQKWSQEFGIVPYGTGMTKAPFDTLGDSLRGTRGILLDLRRRPDKVAAACEAIVPHNIAFGMITSAGDTSLPCFAPLHKGAYPFLSLEQWDKFYWPTWKKVIEGLWALGKRVFFFAEGDWTPYLERIAQLPDKSIVFCIDLTDAQKAKKVLGGRFCLYGGVPTTLLTYGTPQEVKDCVKRAIDELAGDGGFVLAAGGVVMGDAKRENIEAMLEAARQYGAY